VPSLGKPVEQADDAGDKDDPAEEDEHAYHLLRLRARNVLHPISALHAAKPPTATIIENGRSLTNCPNSKAASATLAACDNVSIQTVRCRSFNSRAVLTWV